MRAYSVRRGQHVGNFGVISLFSGVFNDVLSYSYASHFNPYQTPYGINSHARGTPLRPFIYYAAEDFIAIDGLQDREFRVGYNARYESNKSFRRLVLWLTLWWISGVVIYLGCLSAVIWSLEFHYAFGLSLGVLFTYIVIWALVSYWWVQIEMEREKKAYEAAAVGTAAV